MRLQKKEPIYKKVNGSYTYLLYSCMYICGRCNDVWFAVLSKKNAKEIEKKQVKVVTHV